MKSTFGKGLESLIPKKADKRKEVSKIKQDPIFYIETQKIKPNPYQPRQNFDQEGLETLADSIKEHGILQPLLVTKIETETSEGTQVVYQLIAGERRLLAAKMLGLIEVPVIIRNPTEQEKLAMSIIENVQRLDLNPIEKAEAYRQLQEQFNFLQKDIAKMVGRSREAIANTLRLFGLPEEIKKALREERISEGHARAMLAIGDVQKQKTLFQRTLKDGLNVREVERLAQKLEIWKPIKKQISSGFQEIKNLEIKIKEVLGIKNLKLKIEVGKPKLTIFFSSKKEVESLLEKIK